MAVIPDAAYDLCAGAQAEAFQMSVVLISYSMFVPYLLLVFQTMLKTSQSIDLQKLSAHLQTVQNSMIALQSELDGRIFAGQSKNPVFSVNSLHRFRWTRKCIWL
ncbi:MAG: hypothetical protein H6650_16650 [Ardenticatenales bacterium]|nr:hypothetical protein [Ardenticatenales bacterium]